MKIPKFPELNQNMNNHYYIWCFITKADCIKCTKLFAMILFSYFLFIAQIQARNRDSDRCYFQGLYSVPVLRGPVQFHGSEEISMTTCRQFCGQLGYVRGINGHKDRKRYFLDFVCMVSMLQIYACAMCSSQVVIFSEASANAISIAKNLGLAKNVVDSSASE